jgi:hypothetical protein
MNINDAVPNVTIPNRLYKIFCPEISGNDKPLKWNDNIIFEEKKELHDTHTENTLQHICANLFLCVQILAGNDPSNVVMQKTINNIRTQLKSFGINVSSDVEISDEELVRIIYLYYTM